MPDAPTRGLSTDADTLHVEWLPMDDEALTGGSQIIYYSVYKDGTTD